MEKTLYVAALKSHYDIVKVLLKVGMEPNVSSARPSTQLPRAEAWTL